MADLEKKIADFSNVILTEAQRQKEDIISDIEKSKSLALHEREMEFLEEAYEDIQKAVGKYSKEQNGRILKEEMNAKKRILKKREEIINAVFTSAQTKLSEFTVSAEYEQWLVMLAKKVCGEIGTGTIQLCEKDDKYKALLKKEIPDAEVICSLSDSLIGGLTAQCGNLSADYTITQMLSDKHSEFLKTSGLTINL